MAEHCDNEANGEGHVDSVGKQLPGPATALRILELMKDESGAEDWVLWLKAPLEHAVSRGDGDLTAALLDAGADPTVADGEGVPVLGVASREGHVAVISAVAARHPDVLEVVDSDSGYGALHYAAKHDRTDSIDALVEAGVDLELQDAEGYTALHVAAATIGCEAAVEALLRHGADKEQEENGELTPFLVAVKEGNEAAATVLIEAGASIVGTHYVGKVMELAADGGHVSIMRTLVQRGVDVDAGSDMGTAMHGAAWCDRGLAIDFLVEAGADVDAKAPFDGSTPFHIASQRAGAFSSIRALASHGADVNARKANGDTPLHVAASNCLFEQSAATVDALLRAGADETMVNAAFETPADVLERRAAPYADEGIEVVEQIRRLLANAPADRADRAWTRRGFVVMCRAFPDRARLEGLSRSCPAIDSATSPPEKAALRKACGAEETDGGERGATNTAPNREALFPGDFRGAMGRLIGLQKADVFRAVVEFL